MFWIVLLLVITVAWLATSELPRRIVEPKRVRSDRSPEQVGYPATTGKLSTADGCNLAYHYVPATGRPRGNLVVLHGKDSSKEAYLEYLPHLCPYGYNVLLYDSRAHGESEGRFTTFGYYEREDVLLFTDHLRELAPDLPTGVFGHSMGGAVAIGALAGGGQIDFGIVESTFTTLSAIVHAYASRQADFTLPYWVTIFILEQAERIAGFRHAEVDPVRHVAHIRVPVLVIHGEVDQEIDVAHGRALFAAMGSTRKEWYEVTGGGHDDLTAVGGTAYFRRIRAFLDSVTD